MMALVKLPCVLTCGFETIPLEYSQAKELLELHMRYAHPVPSGGQTGNKKLSLNPADSESLNTIGTKQRHQERGELSSDGWRTFEIKKDGQVKLRFSKKELKGKLKWK